MNKAEAIAKIKKCLQLGASANEFESANALRQARKLMEKYQISEQEMTLSDIGETGSKIHQKQSPPEYICVLFNTIADIMACRVYMTRSEDGCAYIMFVGLLPNDELASYAFDTLQRKLKAARKEYIASELKYVRLRSNKVKRADVYCMGWVYAVADAVSSLKVELPELVNTYIALERSGLVTGKGSRSVKLGKNRKDANDFNRGHGAGSDVDIHRAVNGSQAKRISAQG